MTFAGIFVTFTIIPTMTTYAIQKLNLPSEGSRASFLFDILSFPFSLLIPPFSLNEDFQGIYGSHLNMFCWCSQFNIILLKAPLAFHVFLT